LLKETLEEILIFEPGLKAGPGFCVTHRAPLCGGGIAKTK